MEDAVNTIAVIARLRDQCKNETVKKTKKEIMCQIRSMLSRVQKEELPEELLSKVKSIEAFLASEK